MSRRSNGLGELFIAVAMALMVVYVIAVVYLIASNLAKNNDVINFYDANATLIWAVFAIVAMVGLGTMMKRYGKDGPIETKIIPGCVLGCGGTIVLIILFTGIGELYNLLPDNMNKDSEINLFIFPSAFFVSAVITLWFLGELGHFTRALFRRSKK